MPPPRWLHTFIPAFVTEAAMMTALLAEPIYAMEHFKASPLALGVLGMGNAGGYALLVIAAGWISDRTGRRRWMLLGTVSQIILGLLLPHVHRLGTFIALACAQMTLLAFFWPCYMSLISETTPHERLSRILSRWNMSWCSGAILGSALSGLLYDRVGPAAPFYVAAALVSVSLVIQLTVHPGPRVPAAAHGHHIDRPRVASLRRQAWLVVVANFFVIGLLIYLFPKLAEGPRYRLGATAISTLHGLRMGGMLLTFALMSLTARWHFRQWPVNLCFGLMLVMMALTAAAPAAWAFLAPFAIFGVTTGIAYGLSAYYSLLSPESRGAVVGIHEAFLSSGSTVGPIFGGWMIALTGRPEAPFWIGMAPIALLWWICQWLIPRRRT